MCECEYESYVTLATRVIQTKVAMLCALIYESIQTANVSYKQQNSFSKLPKWKEATPKGHYYELIPVKRMYNQPKLTTKNESN